MSGESFGGYENENERPLGRLMSVKEVMQETTLSRTTIYRRMHAGDFPQSIILGARRIAWSSNAIERWKTQAAKLGRSE